MDKADDEEYYDEEDDSKPLVKTPTNEDKQSDQCHDHVQTVTNVNSLQNQLKSPKKLLEQEGALITPPSSPQKPRNESYQPP